VCWLTLFNEFCPQESVASLKFGNRAQKVKNHAVCNEDKDEQALLSSYKSEIEQLRDQLANVRCDLRSQWLSLTMAQASQADALEMERLQRASAQAHEEKHVIVNELVKQQQAVRVKQLYHNEQGITRAIG